LVEHASAIAKLNKDACFLVRKEIVYSIQLIIGEKYIKAGIPSRQIWNS